MTKGSPRLGGPVLASALLVSLSLLAATPGAGAGFGPAGLAAAQPVVSTSCATSTTSARHGRLLGVVAPRAVPGGAACGATALAPNAQVRTAPPTTTSGPASTRKSAAFSGSPPLLYHGGPLMGTGTTPGDVTVVPIFWDPANTMSAAYKSVITTYVANVAADDGKPTNVYSADLQYGAGYHVHAGTAITATGAITNGCSPDSGAVYSDNSGYSECVTDAQIQAELNSVLSANSLPHDLAHSYMVLLPKGVESCSDGLDNAQGGQCTISQGGGTFCAYHSNTAADAVYSDLPFPIYSSPTGFTCGSEASLGTNQSPNGELDADVVLDVFSHELNESITDPLGSAWFDRAGNEIADDCAATYGSALGGRPGALYNQTINGAHYLTQEEFSNEDYHASKKTGCIQRVDLPIAAFKVAPRAPRVGRPVRFNARTSKGSIVAYAWNFDGAATASGRIVKHAFVTRGTHFVTLTVTDATGMQKQTTAFVVVH